MDRSNYYMVAALDLGNKYSRCALSFKSAFEKDPLNIRVCCSWPGASGKVLLSETPTCVLLDKNKDLKTFGYEAEHKFNHICMDDDQNDNYFFRGFNIKKDITRDMILMDENGKSLLASHVFKMFIKAFVNHLMEALDMVHTGLEKDDIRWVIPVSADLTDTGKQLLRSCAEQAGIPSDQLMVVSETEAAFIYCHHLAGRERYPDLKDVSEYMVVQLGGSFADITVLKKDNNQVIEKFRTTGNECDDSLPYETFLKFLIGIFGSQLLTSLRKEEPSALTELERQFKFGVKRKGDGKRNGKFYFEFPYCTLDSFCEKYFAEDLSKVICSSIYGNDISLLRPFMGINKDLFHTFYKPTIDKIIYLMENVFADYRDSHEVTAIVMVGDLSECILVQEAVRQTFSKKNIIIPDDPKLAVVHGAVVCGHQLCEYKQISSSEEMSDSILTKLSQMNSDDFKDLVALGTFATYENRVYLAGPCNIGKSSLASILIGEEIPKTWFSTDGLIIHFGRNGIDLSQRKMIPLKKGSVDVLEKLLRGNPQLEEHQTQTYSSRIKQNDNQNKNEFHDATLSNLKKNEKESSIQIEINRDPSKQQHKSTSTSKRTPFDGRPKIPPKPDLKIIKGIWNRPLYSAGRIQDCVLDKIKQGSYKMHIAPSDLVDFGGQKSFDMTHQLFIQHKGTFILMFDGRKGLYSELDEYPQGNVTAASILEHWINSVLTYCSSSDDKMPRIMFAATHSDTFSKDEKEKLSLQYKEELIEMFSSHKLHDHIIYDKVFFINATDAADPSIDNLKDALVDIAFKQSTWGRRMPIVWVPLDLQIADLRVSGVQMVTKKRILEVNKSNKEFALSERRLEDFLLVQHSIGKLLYFDEPLLRDFIVIQPEAMVNILRSFITDRMFWPKEESLRHILENVSSTGVLKKIDLFTLWSQPAFCDIMTDERTKEYILQVLLHLDILVEPKRYTEKDTAADLFLVPCMAKETIPANIQKNATDDKAICIAYRLKETVIPSALAFKLIGASISIWPLKVVEARYCLYFQAAILDADRENTLQIQVKGQKILAYLINAVSKDLISPDLATTTQECLTLALRRILQFYCQCFGKQEYQVTTDLFEIEVGEVCKGEICLLPLSDAKTKTHWRCKNGATHLTKCSLNWFFDKKTKHCVPTCTGLKNETLLLKPNDHHFVQLASSMALDDFYNFFIHLGMTKIEYDGLNFRYFSNPLDFMLMGLFEWRNKIELESTATFGKLLEALKAIKLEHYLCQVHREDHSLVEKAHSRLQDIPSDHVIDSLTEQTLVGDCVVHLGVELGLSIGKIKEAMFNHPRDLKGQIHALLTQWKQWSKPNSQKPTIYRLMVALKRIKAAEGLAFVKSTYGVE